MEYVRRLFNLLPVIESHIENLICFKLIEETENVPSPPNQNILQDYFVTIQVDNWSSNNTTQHPSVIQQMCEAAEHYRDILASNYYFPLQKFIDDQDPESDTMTTPTDISPATPQPGTGSTTQTSIPNNHNFHVDMIDLGDLTSLIRDQQEQDRASDSYENEIQTQEAAESNIFVYRVDIKRTFSYM